MMLKPNPNIPEAMSSITLKILGQEILVKFSQSDLALKLKKRWGSLEVTNITSKPSIEVTLIQHETPNGLTHVQNFINQNLYLHSSSAQLILGYFYKYPLQIFIQLFKSSDLKLLELREEEIDRAILAALERAGIAKFPESAAPYIESSFFIATLTKQD